MTRTGEFAERDLDEAVYTESGHMPSWAEDSPADYWDAADLFERANGRLYLSADFALPRGLDLEEHVAMAHAFVAELTDAEHLPYTLAIHSGRDGEGREHNPHAHVLISERVNDGIARERQQWFRRANSAHPEMGGAPKTRTFHGRPWVEHARERWAAMTNNALAEHGRADRVDHRSFERQGMDRDPGRHFGPAAAYMVSRGLDHERLTDSAERDDHHVELGAIDSAIATLERERADLIDLESRTPSGSGEGGGRSGYTPGDTVDRDDDWMPGR